MAFIVASATAVLSLSRFSPRMSRSLTASATDSIANRSFPGSLGTENSARVRLRSAPVRASGALPPVPATGGSQTSPCEGREPLPTRRCRTIPYHPFAVLSPSPRNSSLVAAPRASPSPLAPQPLLLLLLLLHGMCSFGGRADRVLRWRSAEVHSSDPGWHKGT